MRKKWEKEGVNDHGRQVHLRLVRVSVRVMKREGTRHIDLAGNGLTDTRHLL